MDPVPELTGQEQLLLLCEGCQFGHKVAAKLSVDLCLGLIVQLSSGQGGGGGQHAQADTQQLQGTGPCPHPGGGRLSENSKQHRVDVVVMGS